MLFSFASLAPAPSADADSPAAASPPSASQSSAASQPSASQPSASQPSASQPSTPPAAAAAAVPSSPLTRHLQQLGLFVAGASFFAASVAVSRRAVLRRRLEALPAFHTCNRLAPPADASDRFGLAAEALGLATLNVFSFGVLLTGGIGWGFDLCSVAELRARTQASFRRRGRELDPEAEREMEAAMRSLLEGLGMDASLPEKEAAAGGGDRVPAGNK